MVSQEFSIFLVTLNLSCSSFGPSRLTSIPILFFTNWQWYFKLASLIGSLGIIGSLILSLKELFKVRRNYLDTIKEMENIKIYFINLKGGKHEDSAIGG
jgi:hypothetical protein